jgi:ABC-type branched-subunit amino acid transport system ATPase component
VSRNGSTVTPLLAVEGLRARYGPVPVLHGIDFAIDSGEIVVILGANGAGKTTTSACGPSASPAWASRTCRKAGGPSPS